MAWHDKWPHKVCASVLLLDGKIEGWKTGYPPKKEPGEFRAYWKRDRLSDYTVEYTCFEVNNNQEHNEAFRKLAREWFRQWELADDLRGSAPYESPVNYFDEARKLLPNSNCLRRRYAAVIVSPLGEPLSAGWNEAPIACTTCSRDGVEHNSGDYSECRSIHAEQMALLGVDLGQLQGSVLYLVCDKDDKPEPCPICKRLMAYCGVELKEALT